MQKESANIWKENVLKNLEKESLEYETVRKFLRDNESSRIEKSKAEK